MEHFTDGRRSEGTGPARRPGRLSGEFGPECVFTERNSPTLLVIDSLDEAHDSDERIRQADTLPWQIVITSRPSSWNHQLIIGKENRSHRVGELKPLRYPHDIERWFEVRPQSGKALATQIAQRPELQAAATVPLILAFYCVVGGTASASGLTPAC